MFGVVGNDTANYAGINSAMSCTVELEGIVGTLLCTRVLYF